MSLACFVHVTPQSSRSSLALLAPQRRLIRGSRKPLRADHCLASAVTVSQPVEQLQSWADRHRKQLQNSRVDAQDQTAVLATSTSAQSGQSLLSVPDSSWLSLQVVAKSELGAAVKALEPWLQLAVFILYGLLQKNSDWSQYLHALPSAPDVPLLWAEDELDELEGTQLLSTVQGYR